MKRKTFYYVEALFGYPYRQTRLFGHTDNPWMATQFLKSLKNNQFLMESYLTKEDAVDGISMFEYMGTLEDFHNEVKEMFCNVITGEDILGTFETGMNAPLVLDIPKLSIVSTCGDVLGGTFLSYAERFLLPQDIIGVQRAMQFIDKGLLHFVRDDLLTVYDIHVLVLLFDVIKKYSLFSDNSPPFLNREALISDAEFDTIRYGILKGWYTAI